MIRPLIILLVAGLAHISSGAGEIPVGTVVRFNTNCARCHEGQCSGRLSFNLDHTAAANHIRRHAGDVSGEVQRDMHTVLVHMKQHCAYYPMRLAIPPGKQWGNDVLAQLRGPGDGSYFVPLGPLAAGQYRARLRFGSAAEACAQIISANFEIDEHPGLLAPAGGLEFEFSVEEHLPHYLRLQVGKSSVLERLEILPASERTSGK